MANDENETPKIPNNLEDMIRIILPNDGDGLIKGSNNLPTFSFPPPPPPKETK